MGVPERHPFFGNQYTTGGYIRGTYNYEPIEKLGIESLDTVPDKIQKCATHISQKQKLDNPIVKKLAAKRLNKDTLIVGGAILFVIAVGGFITYKLVRKNAKEKQDSLLSIELHNVGTCTYCGEPLIGSTYVPEGEEDSHKAYIICKKCGEKNFARYTDETDLAITKVDL